MKNYYEKDSFIIRYDEGNHLLIHAWKVAPTSQEFREGSNIVIAAFEHFKTGKLIGDVRQLGAVQLDDQQWILSDWIPQARKAGFSCSAVIVSQDIFTQMTLEGMSGHMEDLSSKHFDNMKDAVDWIKQF
jgi:hypothetical protein